MKDVFAPQMARRWSALVALVLAASICGGCTSEDDAQASSTKKKDFSVSSAVLVETAPARSGAFSVQGDYAGEFVAQRTAEVAFEVSGRIIELGYDLGDRVDKGEGLAAVDQTSYAQKVREAGAAVAMAEASLGEATVAVENLEADLKRKRPLLDKQLISEREVEDLESQLLQARQKIQVAEATLAQHRARLQTARENLRHTKIRAPFAARIARRHIDLGSFVGPNQPVFRLVSDSAPYLRVKVPERDAGNIELGKPVEVRVGAIGGARLDGEVARVAPAVDPQTRMLQVDVTLEAPADKEASDDADRARVAQRIRPGMYAQARVQLGSRDEAVTVPKQALLEERGGAPFVWVVDGGKARKQNLLVGLRGRDRVEVVEGLSGGETIVLRGFEKLEPGATVESLSQQSATADPPSSAGGGPAP